MNCQICGKPSGFYPLCGNCFKLKDAGKIIKCEVCNTWHYADKPCKCPSTSIHTKKNDLVDDNGEVHKKPQLTCLICGQDSNGLHFCKSCYAKYKDRSVDIRITNCTDVQILDEYGNKTLKCADGRFVRSRAEWMISQWFFEHKIRVIYEPDFWYEENGETKALHPDFCLPDFNDIYIEYCELTNKPYLKKKQYTQQIYQNNNKRVIIMDDNDLKDLSKFFFEHLRIK